MLLLPGSLFINQIIFLLLNRTLTKVLMHPHQHFVRVNAKFFVFYSEFFNTKNDTISHE